VQLADESRTTIEEQRTTAWMPYESLAESLDPHDPSLTVEGLPAPTRVVMTGIAK
jgi:tRNA (mo5U34)-methyltransferase